MKSRLRCLRKSTYIQPADTFLQAVYRSYPKRTSEVEVSDDEIWGISFPIRLGSLFLDREGFSKIN